MRDGNTIPPIDPERLRITDCSPTTLWRVKQRALTVRAVALMVSQSEAFFGTLAVPIPAGDADLHSVRLAGGLFELPGFH
jgi:hypothetical protein